MPQVVSQARRAHAGGEGKGSTGRAGPEWRGDGGRALGSWDEPALHPKKGPVPSAFRPQLFLTLTPTKLALTSLKKKSRHV